MRAWYVIPLLLAIVAPVRSQPAARVAAVVLDADSPVTDVGDTARLRQRVLSGIERQNPLFFELTSRAMAPIPDDARESLLNATFVYQPPKYGGVALSFAEAAEILRKNEAVRDAVIDRECPASQRECGGAVHTASERLVADTELVTAHKLRHLLEAATANRIDTLVLITGGWPVRDPGSVGLDRAARALRANGTRLVVLRTPSTLAFGARVKDASAALAAQLSAPAIALNTDDDVDRARRELTLDDRVSAAPATTKPAAVQEHARAESGTGFDPSDDVLRRAADYVLLFEKTFSAVIWNERYEQEMRVQRRFHASGGSFQTLDQRREFDSELLFVWLPADTTWIAVRDVIAVDGKPRRASERRLPALTTAPSLSVHQLKRLAAENGRFNIGKIVRTFNEPTLALLFLDEHYRQRFSFARSGDETLRGRRARVYEFVERGRPTVIRDADRNLPARGSIWIDRATGHVLQTMLVLSDGASGLSGRMLVHYRADSKFDVLVPAEMREAYASAAGEQITTVATYSNFRRFETAGRLILQR